MGQRELLLYLVMLLNRFHIPYLLTGGFAVSFYGKPRSTNDIDFIIEVVEKQRSNFERLIDTLDPEFIYQKNSILKLGNQVTEFNFMYLKTAIKVDFWVRSINEFQEKYQRRHIMHIENQIVDLVSAEDLILTKLRWCNEIFSDRHFIDCVGMWQIQGRKLDKNFLETEAIKLGLKQLLHEVTTFPTG